MSIYDHACSFSVGWKFDSREYRSSRRYINGPLQHFHKCKLKVGIDFYKVMAFILIRL